MSPTHGIFEKTKALKLTDNTAAGCMLKGERHVCHASVSAQAAFGAAHFHLFPQWADFHSMKHTLCLVCALITPVKWKSLFMKYTKWRQSIEDSLIFSTGPEPDSTDRGYLNSCVYLLPHLEFDMAKGTDPLSLFPVLLLKLQPACVRFPGRRTAVGGSDRLLPHVTLGTAIWRLALPIWAPSWDPPRERSPLLCGTDGIPFELAHSVSSVIHVDLVIFLQQKTWLIHKKSFIFTEHKNEYSSCSCCQGGEWIAYWDLNKFLMLWTYVKLT